MTGPVISRLTARQLAATARRRPGFIGDSQGQP
jgi:hypothetical protein